MEILGKSILKSNKDREEHSIDQYRSKLKLSENFVRHWSLTPQLHHVIDSSLSHQRREELPFETAPICFVPESSFNFKLEMRVLGNQTQSSQTYVNFDRPSLTRDSFGPTPLVKGYGRRVGGQQKKFMF